VPLTPAYNGGVSGVHRSTTESRVTSARKSAAWLIQLAAVTTVLLTLPALVAFVSYLVIAQPAWAWLFPLAIALLSAVWIGIIGGTAWWLLRKRLRPPADRALLIRGVLGLLGCTIMAFSAIGQHYGWTHGGAESALTWCGCLSMGAFACWLIGERRFLAALRARAVGRQEPSG
jgi:uncharacterized integral membrane protein